MNKRELVHILNKLGFEYIGNNGHSKYANPVTRKTTVVANHTGDIPTGTLNDIWHQVGANYLRNVNSIKAADEAIERHAEELERARTAHAAPAIDKQVKRVLQNNYFTEGFYALNGTFVFGNKNENLILRVNKLGGVERHRFETADAAYEAFTNLYYNEGGDSTIRRGGIEALDRNLKIYLPLESGNPAPGTEMPTGPAPEQK